MCVCRLLRRRHFVVVPRPKLRVFRLRLRRRRPTPNAACVPPSRPASRRHSPTPALHVLRLLLLTRRHRPVPEAVRAPPSPPPPRRRRPARCCVCSAVPSTAASSSPRPRCCAVSAVSSVTAASSPRPRCYACSAFLPPPLSPGSDSRGQMHQVPVVPSLSVPASPLPASWSSSDAPQMGPDMARCMLAW
jgi:hypothetical protein